MDFGLSRITRLIRDVHPKLPWKAIHIAGTNGKGTTSAFVSGLLHHAGTSVGRFNSPHLIHRHDCISINEKTIDKSLFDAIEREIKQRNDDAGIKATSFELLTATAFEAFVRAKVAVGVVECGLGGARDATNVLNADEVLCSLITSIGTDHKDVLGPDPLSIAREKAGIFKKDVPVVVLLRPTVKTVLREIAEKTGCPFYFNQVLMAQAAFKEIIAAHSDSLNTKARLEESLELGPQNSKTRSESLDWEFLPFQLKALAQAYFVVMVARKRDPDLVPEKAVGSIEEALQIGIKIKRNWRGRMQWLSITEFAGRKADVLIDGAHNDQATKQLRKYVSEKVLIEGQIRPVTWVIAMSGNKDIPAALSKLARPNDRFVFTQFGPVDGMPWATPAAFQLLNDAVRNLTNGEVKYSPTPGEALRTAVKITPEEELIVVTGSLYLIGDILRIPSIGGLSLPPHVEQGPYISREFRPTGS